MKTRRENDIPGCVPGTRREGVHEGAPATRREGPGDAGATRRESTGTYGLSAYGNQLGRQSRMLPEELTTRYLPLRELSGGTQSDVMVVEDRETGEEAVVKMYRQPGNPYDLATSTKLDRADAKHVVRVTDRGSSDGFAWEVQEYCVYGTLTNVESLRRPLSPAQFRVVVAELGTALIHLHELSIVHRDLKPGNVLVRSIDPLDLVLADFGLAKEVALSMDVGSVGGTFLYMPPEAFIGEFGSASDWWALGVMAYELLAGHHFFLEPSSRIPNEDKIRHDIATGNYTIERVGDDRQWLLLRGLLTRDRKNRWGSAQFTEWLAGSSPAVIEDKTPDLSETRGPQLAHTFAGTVVRTPEELAAAIRNNWDAAGAEIAGTAEPSPDWLALDVPSHGTDQDLVGLRAPTCTDPRGATGPVRSSYSCRVPGRAAVRLRREDSGGVKRRPRGADLGGGGTHREPSGRIRTARRCDGRVCSAQAQGLDDGAQRSRGNVVGTSQASQGRPPSFRTSTPGCGPRG